MDFDEYEYLEKTVENPDFSKEHPPARNGVESEEKRHRSSSRSRAEDGERPSKRVKSDEDRDRHRERDRDRGSSRNRMYADHHVKDEEKERRRSSRDERNGREREKDRERERHTDKDREKREKERGKDRDKDRDREREKEKEKEKIRERERGMEQELERERERSRRSRSRSERHREEERTRYRERSRDREYKERDPRSARAISRPAIEPVKGTQIMVNRHYKEKKEEAAEPEADPERDQRTVFAYQINLKADERDVYEFFSRAGKVRDVRLIMDRNSRRSKGVGYIEFYDAMSVPMAIALSGQKLLGQAVMVKPSEAEKNLVQSTSAAGGAAGALGAQSGGARKLYVGNLHFNITEEQLRQVFESFGTVELVQLPLDPETGHCKGFGFIQFARLEDARAAQSINGQLEIAGRTIKVSAVTEQVGMPDSGANTGDLDDDEGGGLALNARSRALLMQKLDRSGTATSVVNTLGTPVANPALPLPTVSVLGIPPAVGPLVQPSLPSIPGLPNSLPIGAPAVTQVNSIGVPSECLLLKNMFDPSIETEPDFDLDIKEDVQDECSKYGVVQHIFVDKDSAGYVYLRFDDVSSSSNAQRALHGRWFAGKMITATFMVPHEYEAKFPARTS